MTTTRGSPEAASTTGSVERELKDQVRALRARTAELEAALARATSSGSATTGGVPPGSDRLVARPIHGGAYHGAAAPGCGSAAPPRAELGVLGLAAKRVASLLFFLGCLSATAVILESWEKTLAQQVELTFFVPLMIGHGGNTGGSVVGSTIAALASGGDAPSLSKTLARELGCALVVGSTLGSAAGALLPQVGVSRLTATIIACALLSITLLSSVVGATLPFVLRALKFDAATVAPPACTTMIDAMGLVTYLTIAERFIAFDARSRSGQSSAGW